MKSPLERSAVWFNEIITGKRFQDWWKEFKKHWLLIIVSLVLLIIALSIEIRAGNFVRYEVPAKEVGDLIISNIRPIDLTFIFVHYFSILFGFYFIYPLFFRVKILAKAISQFSLLVLVRSIFICLTHLQTPSDAIRVNYFWIFDTFGFENDMFFSGHTAIPFLGFLIYDGWVRYLLLASSIIIGASALLMHRHYSIDVFAAFFITYAVFKLGEYISQIIEKRQIIKTKTE